MTSTQKTRVTLTAEQIASYSAGEKTQTEIAKDTGVSLPTVNKLLKGVTKPLKRKYTSVKNNDRNIEVVRLFTQEKKTLREIAAQFGCTHQNISLILKRNDVDPGQQLAARNNARSAASQEKFLAQRAEKAKTREEKLQVLSTLWKEGKSVEEIRVATGLKSVGAVNVKIVLARRKFGVELFPLRNHRKPVVAVSDTVA